MLRSLVVLVEDTCAGRVGIEGRIVWKDASGGSLLVIESVGESILRLIAALVEEIGKTCAGTTSCLASLQFEDPVALLVLQGVALLRVERRRKLVLVVSLEDAV